MLREIESDAFRVPKVEFHLGLNVVIGDAAAANSIGKSSLLMVIDFIFGGADLLDKNDDIVPNIGHHEYRFAFEFDGQKHHFKRATELSEFVIECDAQYNQIKPLTVAQYTDWLIQAYATPKISLSFRSMVAPYSRVWPKDNVTNVHRPLHAVPSQSASDCINNLIKLFGRFSEVEHSSAVFAQADEHRRVWRKAEGMEFLSRIGKREYEANESALNLISEEVAEIKTNLAQYALNLRAIVDREVMDLAQDKDLLLRERSKVFHQLTRTQQNLQANKHVKSSQLEGLKEYFPDIQVEKLVRIEEFHSAVARLLKQELVQTERTLRLQLNSLDVAIADIDRKVSDRVKGHDNPNVIVDRVYQLSEKWATLKAANKKFEKKEELQKDFVEAKESLETVKLTILTDIESAINQELEKLAIDVYGQGANAPKLVLGQNSYKYEIDNDTGTGTAFANLVLFDLAILSLTELPFLIHDLPLFKNVEHDAVAAFVVEYTKFSTKQIFTVLDEIEKYGATTVDVLRKRCVLELNEQDVLYKKKWRSR